MSDKYDEWAESYVRENGWFNDNWMVTGCRYVSDAMRFCAAKLEAEREKETCVWILLRIIRPIGGLKPCKVYMPGCGANWEGEWQGAYCPHCGRRIVEGGEK